MTPGEVASLVAQGIAALISVIEQGTGATVTVQDINAALQRYLDGRTEKERLVADAIAAKPDEAKP